MAGVECREETTNNNAPRYAISVVSELVRPIHPNTRARLTEHEMSEAHWQVLLECEEVKHYLDEHQKLYEEVHPNSSENSRRINFHPYFLDWVCISLFFFDFVNIVLHIFCCTGSNFVNLTGCCT